LAERHAAVCRVRPREVRQPFGDHVAGNLGATAAHGHDSALQIALADVEELSATLDNIMYIWTALSKGCALSISLLLEMAVSANPDRATVAWDGNELTTGGLSDLADGGAGVIANAGARHVAYVGTGGAMLPTLMFSAARAGVPVTPLNYRLSATDLRKLIDRLPQPLVVADAPYLEAVGRAGNGAVSSQVFLRNALTADPVNVFAEPEQVAVVLFTSGTTSRPKAVELTHANLTNYITQTVEFGSAGTDDAALICVPPYHIAGVSAVLSNLYAGRRMVYLPRFDAEQWIGLISEQKITNATVVPTMLDRIIEALEARPVQLPSLKTLAYGGSRVPVPLVRRALKLLPEVGFVNAYGLTETSSTIAVLTPDDHRQADRANDIGVDFWASLRRTDGKDLMMRAVKRGTHQIVHRRIDNDEGFGLAPLHE